LIAGRLEACATSPEERKTPCAVGRGVFAKGNNANLCDLLFLSLEVSGEPKPTSALLKQELAHFP
jgi:hypothetical protein